MRSRTRTLVLSSFAFALVLVASVTACTGDDVTLGPEDAGPDAHDDVTLGGDDASSTGDAGADATGRPPWVLLTLDYASDSELVAYSVPGRAVDGRFTFPGSIAQTYVQASTPWLLEEKNDLVVKLDPNAPWRPGPSWSVRLDDAVDGGKSYADPIAAVAGPAGKAYVPRFNRNKLAVIDTTATGADAAAPLKTIDFSSYLDATDRDGNVDMAGAVYVASQQRLYVVLGNFDLTNTDPQGFYTLCGLTSPIVVAVDTTTDTIASFGPGGRGATFTGYNPPFNAIFYDAPRNRLLVLSGGCNVPGVVPDAGPGPLVRRQIDAIDLGTGAPTKVLDLTAKGFPTAYVPVDATHLALGFDFGGEADLWDITTGAIGPALPTAPDAFAYDGHGNLYGPKTTYLADGGSTSRVIATPLPPLDGGAAADADADAAATDLGAVPFSKANGFPPASADFWPASP